MYLRLVGRYCNYLLPKQAWGTPQIKVNPTQVRQQMGHPVLTWSHVETVEIDTGGRLLLLRRLRGRGMTQGLVHARGQHRSESQQPQRRHRRRHRTAQFMTQNVFFYCLLVTESNH